MIVPPVSIRRAAASRSGSTPFGPRIIPRHGARESPPTGAAPGVSWDIGRVAITAPTRVVGPAIPIAIGRTDDPLEQDAARAETASGPEATASLAATTGPSGRFAGTAPAEVAAVLRQPGMPLDESTRAAFGARFGFDFAGVRVHTDSAAQRSAAAVHAEAYTVGPHIVFGARGASVHTDDRRRLLAHELTHVMQQAHVGTMLQRQPRDRPRGAAPPKNGPESTGSAFVPADLVSDITRDNETWRLTVEGHTSVDSLTRAMFTISIVPPGVTVTLEAALIDPVERGKFVITGLTPVSLQVMEPSYAKLFSARGLVADAPESDELKNARHEFLKRHRDYSDATLLNIVRALNRVTKGNPELLLAYYRHYATHELRDEGKWGDPIDFVEGRDAGGTSGGNTRIDKKVLQRRSPFPTDDSLSLLGGTLIHEFAHTKDGRGENNPLTGALREARAAGVEMFLSERMGDATRAKVISKKWSSTIDLKSGAGKKLWAAYYTMKALYHVIDQGGPEGAKARVLSVEFISGDESNYSKDLKRFIAEHR